MVKTSLSITEGRFSALDQKLDSSPETFEAKVVALEQRLKGENAKIDERNQREIKA